MKSLLKLAKYVAHSQPHYEGSCGGAEKTRQNIIKQNTIEGKNKQKKYTRSIQQQQKKSPEMRDLGKRKKNKNYRKKEKKKQQEESKQNKQT